MRLREGILIFVMVLIILFVNVNAANSCSNSRYVILRISSDTNAHGEVHNGASHYTTEICYDSLFPNAQDPGTNPWVCENSNTVLRLSGATNAHASGPSGGYTEDICYKGLKCELADSCRQGLVGVLRLSGDTNAHLETINQDNYGKKICCNYTSAAVSPPSCDNDGRKEGTEECDGSDFGSLGNECRRYDSGYRSGNLICSECKINTSDCSSLFGKTAFWAVDESSMREPGEGAIYSIGESVALVARGVAPGSSVNFTIYDRDGLFEGGIDDFVREVNVNADSFGIAKKTISFLPSDYGRVVDGSVISGPGRDEFGLLTTSGKNLELYFTAVSQDDKQTSRNMIALENNIENPPVPLPDGCAKFNGNENGCRNSNDWSADAIRTGIICSGSTRCECSWNVTDQSCKFKSTTVIPGGPGREDIIYRCESGLSMGNCDENDFASGRYFAEFIVQGGRIGECLLNPVCIDAKEQCENRDGQAINVPCGTPTLKLPIFSLGNLIFSFLLISGVYLIRFRRLIIK